MARQPFVQWYTGDWRRDPKTRLLSAEARGVWRELLDIMHELDDYQITGTIDELASMAGLKPAEIRRAIVEIEKYDAGDVTHLLRDGNAVVTLVSRRRKRDIKPRKDANERVKKHRSKQDEEDVTTTCNAPVTPSRARAPSEDEDEDDSSVLKGGAGGRGRPASVEDVWNYSALVHLPDHSAEFFDHFEAAGWRMGNGTGRPMKDWQAAYRNWCRRAPQFERKTGTTNGTLSARQHAGLSIQEQLARGGYRPGDFD